MIRSIALISAICAVPAVCAGQVWPATSVSLTQSREARAPQRSVFAVLAYASQTRVQPQRPVKRPAKAAPSSEPPTMEIKAKDAWFDDQGLRFGGRGFTFKQRF